MKNYAPGDWIAETQAAYLAKINWRASIEGRVHGLDVHAILYPSLHRALVDQRVAGCT